MGPFTLFAPTNDAFKNISTDALKAKTKADLKMVLLGHVTKGSYPLNKLTNGDLPSMDGDNNKIVTSPSGITIDGARILADGSFIADNGIIHTIDQVI